MESKINTQAIECESIEELLTDAKSQEYIMGIENFSLKQIYSDHKNIDFFINNNIEEEKIDIENDKQLNFYFESEQLENLDDDMNNNMRFLEFRNLKKIEEHIMSTASSIVSIENSRKSETKSIDSKMNTKISNQNDLKEIKKDEIPKFKEIKIKNIENRKNKNCTCKRKCRKNVCDCAISGDKCNEFCSCTNCDNGKKKKNLKKKEFEVFPSLKRIKNC